MTEVDPVAGKSLAQIEVGKEGKLEFPTSDGAGRVFVNLEEPGTIGVIDVKAGSSGYQRGRPGRAG